MLTQPFSLQVIVYIVPPTGVALAEKLNVLEPTVIVGSIDHFVVVPEADFRFVSSAEGQTGVAMPEQIGPPTAVNIVPSFTRQSAALFCALSIRVKALALFAL